MKTLLNFFFFPFISRQEILVKELTMAASGEGDRLLESSTPSRPKLYYIPARYVLTLLLFCGHVSLYIFRSEMNITILSLSISEMAEHHNNTIAMNETVRFNTHQYWNYFETNMVLGGFFWGFVVMQIPGSWLSKRLGEKRTLGLSGLFNSVLSALIPFVLPLGPEAVFILRLLSGVTQSVLRPCEFQMITRWAPSHQIHLIRATIMLGFPFELVLAYYLDSFVCEHFSWTYVFYIHSAIGFTWSVFWLTMIHDSPEDHPRMSQEELDLIVETRVTSPVWQNERFNWSKVLSSASFWALVVVLFCLHWIKTVLVSLLPDYLYDGLGLGLVDTRVAPTFAICSVFLTSPLAGFLSDYLISHDFLSKKETRKLMINLGLLFPGFAMFYLCNTDPVLTMVFVAVALGLAEFALVGCINNFIDLAPNLSGQLFGVANTFGTVSGFIAPIILAQIGSDESLTLVSQWHVLFIISCFVLISGGLLFSMFGEGEPQGSWIRE